MSVTFTYVTEHAGSSNMGSVSKIGVTSKEATQAAIIIYLELVSITYLSYMLLDTTKSLTPFSESASAAAAVAVGLCHRRSQQRKEQGQSQQKDHQEQNHLLYSGLRMVHLSFVCHRSMAGRTDGLASQWMMRHGRHRRRKRLFLRRMVWMQAKEKPSKGAAGRPSR